MQGPLLETPLQLAIGIFACTPVTGEPGVWLSIETCSVLGSFEVSIRVTHMVGPAQYSLDEPEGLAAAPLIITPESAAASAAATGAIASTHTTTAGPIHRLGSENTRNPATTEPEPIIPRLLVRPSLITCQGSGQSVASTRPYKKVAPD